MAAGRPREFDVDRALEAALEVFWRKGFEGTSLADLTTAMGINRPSLYAAFGNKESLFRKALERYVANQAAHVLGALEAKTARAVAERLWLGAIELTTCPRKPRGCFLVQSALVSGDEVECVRKEVATRRGLLEERLRERFERAAAEGDLPAHANPADLARYVATVTQGLSVQAADGASAAALRRVAAIALAAIPHPTQKPS